MKGNKIQKLPAPGRLGQYSCDRTRSLQKSGSARLKTGTYTCTVMLNVHVLDGCTFFCFKWLNDGSTFFCFKCLSVHVLDGPRFFVSSACAVKWLAEHVLDSSTFFFGSSGWLCMCWMVHFFFAQVVGCACAGSSTFFFRSSGWLCMCWIIHVFFSAHVLDGSTFFLFKWLAVHVLECPRFFCSSSWLCMCWMVHFFFVQVVGCACAG